MNEEEKGKLGDQLKILSDLLRKQNEIRNMLDTRANILIGFISGLILFLISYQNLAIGRIPYIIILITLFLSLFSAVFALKPPTFNRKKGQEESIFYHDYINSKDFKAYRDEVVGVLGNREKICDAYILEAYNLTKYSNGPKKFYAHLAIRILTYGICLALISYGIVSFIGFISS